MESIANEIENHVSYEYFKKIPHEKYLKLVENNDGGKTGTYTINIRLNENHDSLCMFQNLELMKASKISKYIFQNPPKDCDYVILDERNEKIYFLELKYMKKIEKKEIAEQLKAGKKWAEHLLFCSGLSYENLSNWKESYICLNFRSGRPPRKRSEAVHYEGISIYFEEGNEFSLSKFL